jgi:glutamine synthetase
MESNRLASRLTVINRRERSRQLPVNHQGKLLKVSQFYGENVFKLAGNRKFSVDIQNEINDVIKQKKHLSEKTSYEIAQVVLDWALEKGATHFCHWFQPLTGSTAEKHDSFLSFDGDRPIEQLSASQLMQGEPDASSFPHGGTRSTFEARGYTSWDFSSPIFIKETVNGKTLCIPTAFVSYLGNALDIKTPLLRSNNVLGEYATTFLNLTGDQNIDQVQVTCGTEQEYFLVDKAFFYQREDLVMSGRTLLGSLTPRNQQLEDHYFGTIPDRVLAFMQEVEMELYKLGIPAKTRHNEVAPGQFEIAPIFKDANVAADNNHMLMATLKSVANKHDMVCLLHEKPFAEVNGSGKHLNWSMSDSNGKNLLEPGKTPHENHRFLAMVAIVCEAVNRHQGALRASIAGHGNDHRLGANEAPPSIMSIFLGDTITAILESMISGGDYTPDTQSALDVGAEQLAVLLKDNTDRNRTSPFAFTGNKFEFRAVGSSVSIGFPLSILNTAVAEVLKESNAFLKETLDKGTDISQALIELTKKWYGNSNRIVFNGDGYGQEWIDEARKRGLENLKDTPESLKFFKTKAGHQFLLDLGVYSETEFQSIYNVRLERYNKNREIECQTLLKMVDRFVIPSAISYKKDLAEIIKMGIGEHKVEKAIVENLDQYLGTLYKSCQKLRGQLEDIQNLGDEEVSLKISDTLLPRAEEIAEAANGIEDIVPDQNWNLPTYFELLFIR